MFLQFFSLRLIVASIKLQIEVLEESKVMIPDCKRRIKTAYLDLQELVVSDSDSSNAVLDFQKKILGPAGPQVFIFCRQNKYSGRQKLY